MHQGIHFSNMMFAHDIIYSEEE